MITQEHAFDIGDWIVHKQHGVGQLTETMRHAISGEETLYFIMETANSSIWVPAEQLDGEHIRPLSTPEDIQEVVTVLQRPPRRMVNNFNTRKSRIRQVQQKGTPLALARLVRDLRARRRRKGRLSQTEEQALRTLTQQLVVEWARCMGVQAQAVRQKIDALLTRRAAAQSSRTAVPQAGAAD
ncbi:MAG: hypothetical protein KC425_16175 [Anaerolineales bacterium]|nr:hypothetical protein [Anaerolineales bacterium]